MGKGLVFLGVLAVVVIAVALVLYQKGVVPKRSRRAAERGRWEVLVEDGTNEWVGHVIVSVARMLPDRSQPVFRDLVERVPPGPFQDSGVAEARGKAIAIAEVANRKQ